MDETDRLAMFLYILMRDHLPVGTIDKIIENLDENDLNIDLEYISVSKANMILKG